MNDLIYVSQDHSVAGLKINSKYIYQIDSILSAQCLAL